MTKENNRKHSKLQRTSERVATGFENHWFCAQSKLSKVFHMISIPPGGSKSINGVG